MSMTKPTNPTHQAITAKQVQHIATLADLQVTQPEATGLAAAFEETLKVVDKLQTVDTAGIEPTHQVTGLENIWREDQPRPEFMFSQTDALANAAAVHNGYFVVPQVIDHDA